MTARRTDCPHRGPDTDHFDAHFLLGASHDCLAVGGVVDAINADALRTDLNDAVLACTAPQLLIDVTGLVHLAAAGVEALASVLASPAPRAQAPILVLARSCRVRPVLDLFCLPYVLFDAP